MFYYGPMTSGYNWGWGFLMFVLWIVFLAFVAVVVIRLIRGHGHGINLSQKSDPLDIIKERYAKGEITKEQFEQMKKDLK